MADQNEKRKFLFFSPYTIFGNHQLRHIMTKTNNWTVQNSPLQTLTGVNIFIALTDWRGDWSRAFYFISESEFMIQSDST